MAASYPHFYVGDPWLRRQFTGLTPDHNKHNSYVDIEPISGTPMHGFARSQSNLVIGQLPHLDYRFDRFKNMVLPMFWAEYNQEDLPEYIYNLLYFTVVILPPLQTILSTLGVVLGGSLIARSIYQRGVGGKSLFLMLPAIHKRDKKINKIANTIVEEFEKQSFLRKIS